MSLAVWLERFCIRFSGWVTSIRSVVSSTIPSLEIKEFRTVKRREGYSYRKIMESKQIFAAGNSKLNESTRTVVECVGQESGAEVKE